jgi:hypothetical protein
VQGGTPETEKTNGAIRVDSIVHQYTENRRESRTGHAKYGKRQEADE